MATFSNYVFDVNTENPPQIGPFAPSLSGSSNTVILSAGNVNGVVGTKTVAGILYNEVATGDTTLVSLSVATGVSFSVARKYNGSQFALYFTDRSSTLFTVNTASTLQTVVTANNGFDNRGPDERRHFAMEC
jgi:hypothetical protein